MMMRESLAREVRVVRDEGEMNKIHEVGYLLLEVVVAEHLEETREVLGGGCWDEK